MAGIQRYDELYDDEVVFVGRESRRIAESSTKMAGYKTFENASNDTSDDPHSSDLESGKSKKSNGNGLHQKNNGTFDKRARNVLIVSIILCSLFIIGEIVGGVLSGSLAIITDSSHLLTDLVTYIISIVGLYTSQRAPTSRFTFGWYRVEIMGALVSVMMIWLVTGVLIYLATMRLIHSNYTIEPTVMLITAGAGVFFNVVLISVLFAYNSKGRGNVEGKADMAVVGHSHGQSHGHGHGGNVNVKSALIHVIGDLTQSVGVLVAAFIIYFKPKWKIADPICTYIFGVFVFFTTITFLRSIMSVLMEASPAHIKHSEVMDFIREFDNVSGVHDLHIWSLTTNKSIVSAHVVIGNTVQSSATLNTLNKALKEKFHLEEAILQVEQVDTVLNDTEDCVCD